LILLKEQPLWDRRLQAAQVPLILNLPGGGHVCICAKKDFLASGDEFIGYGITPHVYAEPVPDDILIGRDAILEKGIEVFKEKITGE
jgi:hypothetical protein